MGVASFAIGLLPTYATIGVFLPASVLLIVPALIQGSSPSGGTGGAALMARTLSTRTSAASPPASHMGAPEARRLRSSCWPSSPCCPEDDVPLLGLAHPVPAQRRPGRHRPVRPAQGHRVAAVRAGSRHRGRVATKKRLPIVDVLPQQPAVRAAGHRRRSRRLRAAGPDGHLRAHHRRPGRPAPLHRAVAVRRRLLRADLRPARVRRAVRPDRPPPRHDRRLRRRDRSRSTPSCC